MYAWFLDARDGEIVKAFAFFDSVAFIASRERAGPEPTSR